MRTESGSQDLLFPDPPRSLKWVVTNLVPRAFSLAWPWERGWVVTLKKRERDYRSCHVIFSLRMGLRLRDEPKSVYAGSLLSKWCGLERIQFHQMSLP